MIPNVHLSLCNFDFLQHPWNIHTHSKVHILFFKDVALNLYWPPEEAEAGFTQPPREICTTEYLFNVPKTTRYDVHVVTLVVKLQ